jgi:hypothetical protein
MQGLLEVITLMLALGGFGVDANPKAPTADAVLAYAAEEADLVVHLDVAAVGPRNYKVLVGLPDHPTVKANRELLQVARAVKANVEGVRSMAKLATGLDPIEDITSVTLFVDLVPGQPPRQLAVARGKIPADFVEKLAKTSGQRTRTIDGRAALEMDPTRFLGTGQDGALLVGSKAWVEPRLRNGWKPPARKKGSPWATIAQRLDAKPFLLVAARLDDKAEADLAKQAGDNFIADLIESHELAILALHSDGVTFHWQDEKREGLDRMVLLTEGLVELTRAAHVAPRGLAKIVVASLDSYRGRSKELDALIARKADILRLVNEYSGDGQFKVQVDKNSRTRTLTVRATGRTLAEVVPAVMFVPAIAGFYLFVEQKEAASQPRQVPPPRKPAPPPRKPVPPRQGGGVKGPVKK